MKITEMLTPASMIVPLQSTSKSAVIRELAQALYDAGKLHDLEAYIEAVEAREALGSTGVGFGIAIPHAKSDSVKTPALAYGLHPQGLDYEALDGTNSQLFFMIAAPAGEENLHLQTLAKLSRKLMNDDYRETLLTLHDPSKILAHLSLIDKEEN